MSNAPEIAPCYRVEVDAVSFGLMATLADELGSRFHDGLTIERDGDSVRWTYAGAAAVVSLRPEGTLQATFLDAPSTDAVSAARVSCAYRSASRLGYGLSLEGCGRMVADMTDFFSGVREPRFTFVGAA